MSGKKTALRALLLCQGVLVAGLALSFPFLSLYLHEARGLPMGRTGLAISAALLATAVGQALGGELSDRWGCKRVMAVSIAGRGALTGVIAFAIWREWPVLAIVGAHLGAALVGNLYEPAVRGWVALEHPAGERVRAYGLLRVASNAAWAIGPAAGGVLAGRSYGAMFAGSAAACGLCLAVLVFLVPAAPTARLEEAFSWRASMIAARDPRYRAFALLTLVIACSMSQLVAPMSVHATANGGLSARQVGLLFALNGALVVLLQQAASAAISRVALTSAVAAGCLFYAAGWAWIGFASGFLALAAGVLVVTLGEIVVSPGLTTLAANLAPERGRGRYLGFQGLSYQLGHALGPTLGGAGLEHLSGRWTPAPWLAAGALAVAAGWGFRRLGRELGREEQGLLIQEAA